ncbi:hypothetical protein CDCA_CDCA16G4290 [Cyanidium caldarium]|uniref:Uncharacterized protein n=1 Tax=Cyanidium caldarium TaxID=2771 RepID=A0AAV9J0Z6_CYACA|nr:hypothetical protein CDCA_CDCA16G4290 [Cyanidium caldarium]
MGVRDGQLPGGCGQRARRFLLTFQCVSWRPRRGGCERRRADGTQRRSAAVPVLAARRRLYSCRWRMAELDPDETSAGDRPRVPKYRSQRALVTSGSGKSVSVTEFNDLLRRCGEPERDPRKLATSLEHTFWVSLARLLRGEQPLVALARCISDGALNVTLVDVLVDPALPDPDTMRRNVLRRLLEDVRRRLPSCSVAVVVPDEQVAFYEELKFVAEPCGIKAMSFEAVPDDIEQYLAGRGIRIYEEDPDGGETGDEEENAR